MPVKGQKRKHVPKATYSRNFEEIEAYTAMQLRPDEYASLPGIGLWCDEVNPISKCDVLIWYRYHRILEQLSMGIV